MKSAAVTTTGFDDAAATATDMGMGITGSAALLFNNVVFLVYDLALTVFISYYMIRLRRRLHLPKLR